MPILSIAILVLSLVLMLWLLADTADEFFCPTLQSLVVLLHVPSNLAGITFLAFGNGAPDVFSAIASFQGSGNAADIGIGSIIGSGMFVTTLVVAGAALAAPEGGQLNRRPFVRDVFFYICTIALLSYVYFTGRCTRFIAIMFGVFYIFFIVFCIVARSINLKWKKRKQIGALLTTTEDGF